MANSVGCDSEARTNQWRIAIWGGAALLPLLPLVAMQFTREVNWDLPDFIVFGVMLTAACGTYELAARMTGNGAYRAAVGIGVTTGFILVWINLAVGIIGDEDNVLNLLYGGVLVVGMAGALLARFRPQGMARALGATAIAQGLVAVTAQVAGHFTWVLTAVFVALWLTSAHLFGKAAREQSPTSAAR